MVASYIDFSSKMVNVHGKGKKERLVPISQRGCEWLAFYYWQD
jgi:integrase/recombinase XerD